MKALATNLRYPGPRHSFYYNVEMLLSYAILYCWHLCSLFSYGPSKSICRPHCAPIRTALSAFPVTLLLASKLPHATSRFVIHWQSSLSSRCKALCTELHKISKAQKEQCRARFCPLGRQAFGLGSNFSLQLTSNCLCKMVYHMNFLASSVPLRL